ncbi:hypothetical protein SO802_003241 [Lithocarpus litseifolius]|uniref:Uncharacterized protein n=1 Tax=Lithocarpus litseifolius TaxID=425828 RepID=A0AAW2E285_9ROSI
MLILASRTVQNVALDGKSTLLISALLSRVEEEAAPSQATVKEEEEEVVEISGSEDDFEIFNQTLPLEPPVVDLGHLPLAQVSHGDTTLPNLILLIRRGRGTKREKRWRRKERAFPLRRLSSRGETRQPKLPIPDPQVKGLWWKGGLITMPRSMKKHKAFLSLKREFALADQATHRAKKLVNSSHRQMKEEEGRRITAMDAFNVVEKRIQELNNKLIEADQDKKSTEAALEGAERQAETREQIGVLKKKLEEAEKARDQAKQDGYEVGVAETEEALRAEVSGEAEQVKVAEKEKDTAKGAVPQATKSPAAPKDSFKGK